MIHTTMENTKIISGYKSVMRLAREHPEWLPVVESALEEAKATKGVDFAGAWVLNKAKEKGIRWFPNLRILVTFGVLQKEGTSRGGRRAYYSMPDPNGVEQALIELRTK